MLGGVLEYFCMFVFLCWGPYRADFGPMSRCTMLTMNAPRLAVASWAQKFRCGSLHLNGPIFPQQHSLGGNYRDLILSKELCLIFVFCIYLHSGKDLLHFYALSCNCHGNCMHFMCFYVLFMHLHAFLCIIPTMVLDHDLYYMAPFAIPRAGFCTEFRHASFICSCPGVIFWTTGQIFRPWAQISRPWV